MKSTTCDAMLRYGHLPRVRATFGARWQTIVFQQGLSGGARGLHGLEIYEFVCMAY